MTLVATRMQNIRPQTNVDKYEVRGSRWGVLDLVRRQSDQPGSIITEDDKQKIFRSIGSTVQLPVINYNGGISIGSTRSITISAAENTSALDTVTKTTYAWGFRMFPTLFHNNEIGYEKDFNAKFFSGLYAFLALLDTACATMLNTNKSQVFNDLLGFTNTADVLVATLANRLDFIADIPVVMEANDYFDQLHLVGNGGFQSIIQKLKQSGVYNAENKQMQYLDHVLGFSNRITNGTNQGATLYAVNAASTGIMTSVDREALYETQSKDKGRQWGKMNCPFLDLPIGWMYYEEDGDYNAIAGAASADMTASHAECYGFSVDVIIKAPYNSDIATRPNPIVKFAVSTS